MLAEFTRTQRNLMDAQREISTEKRINAFSDSPSEIGGLMATRAADSRTADFEASAKAVRAQLNLQDTHLDEMTNAVGDLRPAIVDAVATGSVYVSIVPFPYSTRITRSFVLEPAGIAMDSTTLIVSIRRALPPNQRRV